MARNSSIRASCPGSVMILGEHAVLHGRRALACAINRRLTVVLAPRTDTRIQIHSALGDTNAELEDLKPEGPLRFALAALAGQRGRLGHGLDIQIESEFSDRVGLGSSAAVTVAITAAVHAIAGLAVPPETLHEECLDAIRAVQGIGSGADAAASIWGGIVLYRDQPRALRKLPNRCPLTLVYSGYKTPTRDVVLRVEAARSKDRQGFERIFDRIDGSVAEAAQAVERRDWARLGTLLNENQALMSQMGVSTPELDDIISQLRRSPGVLGAKISGSGLGDCALALGAAAPADMPYQRIPVQISSQGIHVDQTRMH